jgi:tight adherence protein C
MTEVAPLLIVLMAFGAVAALVFVAGQYFASQLQLQRRAASSGRATETMPALLESVNALVSSYFDEKRFGVQGTVRAKLRRDLVRAGYFRLDAVNYYIFIKLAVVVIVPIAAYIAAEEVLVAYGWPLKLFAVITATGIAILGPDAYIARRQRTLTDKYRIAFPDLLDLMVVCVDAGLSLEAGIGRLSKEILKRNRELGMNLLILEAETRAGRGMPDALDSFAERLALDEARAFVSTLRQSIELGSDVGDALRVFSEEMRDRRLLRAEERANQLPVKMVLPLGMFIFPVILMVVMVPVILRLLTIMK